MVGTVTMIELICGRPTRPTRPSACAIVACRGLAGRQTAQKSPWPKRPSTKGLGGLGGLGGSSYPTWFASGDRGVGEFSRSTREFELCESTSDHTEVPRCGARTCAGTPCQEAPIPGRKRCRLHGGLSPGAPRGPKNGNYKNGDWTTEAIEERRWLRSLVNSFAKSKDTQ